MNHTFALVDATSFYVSCHRLFEPELDGQPVIVLSNNDSAVVALSKEVKQLGVTRGTPLFQIRDLVSEARIQLRSSMYETYGDISRRLMNTLASFAPEVEPYSVDEAFLRLSDLAPGDRLVAAQRMRAMVNAWVGLPITVGLGGTKTLAKLANRIAKDTPEGIFDLAVGGREREEILAMVAVQDLWGIGPQSARKLHQAGIHSALQLIQAPDAWIRRVFRINGLRLVWELRGRVVFPMQLAPAPPQSIMRAQSFGRPITSKSELFEAVATYLIRAAEYMRVQRLAASDLSVFVSTNRFRATTLQYASTSLARLPRPTSFTGELLHAASDAFERVYRQGYEYHKAGVRLAGLVSESPLQLSLFGTVEEVERQRRLMASIDALNRRYGQDTVSFASVGFMHSWQRRAGYRTPRFSTRWNEILVVYTD